MTDAGALAAENAALKLQLARLEGAMRGLPFGVVVAEAPSGRVLVTSASADRLPNSVGEYDAYTGFRLDGSRVEAEEWPLARSLTSGETVVAELIQMPREDGSEVVYEISSSAILDEAGALVGAVAAFEDVTDRELRYLAEREFVTNAAHELRTPLTVIASAVEVLQAGAKDDPEARDRFLEHIDRATDRLARLGRALLALTRSQTGQEPAKLDIVALCPLLESVAGEIEPHDGVAVAVSCGQELAALANRDLLEQALSNVVQNAALYTLSGSIDLSAHAQNGSVSIEVADTGPGVPARELALIAERFYRPAGSESEGFGLGLSIAAESVRAMGGTFNLGEVEPHGLCVRFVLPLARLVRA